MLKYFFLVLLVVFTISINGDDKIRKIKVYGSSFISVDAEFVEVAVRVQVYGADVDANNKKIAKIVSEIEKSLSSYEIKEGSFALPLIEHGYEKVNSKFSLSKTSSSGSSANDNGVSSCNLILTVLKLEYLGYIYKELSKFDDVSIVGTQFKVKDEESIKLAQYKKALLSAKMKGDVMAATLNSKISQPVLIEEKIEPNILNEVTNRINLDKINPRNNFGKVNFSVNVLVEFQLD